MKSKKLLQNGAAYVLVQAILLGILFLGPTDWWGTLTFSQSVSETLHLIAVALFPLGLLIAIVAAIQLKRNLTPLPMPVERGELIQTGLYAYVRHPIYSGIILLAFGWSVYTQGTLTLCYAFVLALFLNVKSRREEIWLCQKFAGYQEYQKTTKKLITLIY